MHERARGATVGGRTIPEKPDLPRMRAERHARLQQELARQELDGLVLMGSTAVSYAAGLAAPAEDSSRASIFRAVVVVVKGDRAPYVYTLARDGLPPELPPDHAHGPLFPDLEDGADDLVRVLSDHFSAGARLAVDDETHPMLRRLGAYEWLDGRAALAPAKLCKTVDELACIREAQRISELAMVDARRALRPGVHQSDLSAVFLRRAFELGTSAGGIDPIWQVMPSSKDQGPWTSHGGLAYPTASTDRLLREGDVIWVDAGIAWNGYASDYGRTWIASNDPAVPTPRQRDQFSRWRQVVDAVLEVLEPGVSATVLSRAAIEANEGARPWLEHFYLAHGVGTDSAEMPLVGTDLGEDFDDLQVMEPGMVLVLEPVIWDDGAAGYRAEDIVAVTDAGWEPLSGSTYDPFGVPR
jgi:Xaa-Pro aminopeptidase